MDAKASVREALVQCSRAGYSRSNFFVRIIDGSGSGLTPRQAKFIETQAKEEPEHAPGHVPSQFWQEAFSAASMVLPTAYCLLFARDIAAKAAFPAGTWTLALTTYFHCCASVSYHSALAAWDGQIDPYKTPLRVADLSAIHIACITFSWALSRGSWLFTAAMAAINFYFISRLVRQHLQGRTGGMPDVYWLTACTALYSSPMLWRSDVSNYIGAMSSLGLGAMFFLVNKQLDGWGHGVFHLLLLPYIYFLMQSTAVR